MRSAYDYDVGIPVPGPDPATWSPGTRLMVENFAQPGPNGEPPLRLVLLDTSEPSTNWRLRLYDGMTSPIMISPIPLSLSSFFFLHFHQ